MLTNTFTSFHVKKDIFNTKTINLFFNKVLNLYISMAPNSKPFLGLNDKSKNFYYFLYIQKALSTFLPSLSLYFNLLFYRFPVIKFSYNFIMSRFLNTAFYYQWNCFLFTMLYFNSLQFIPKTFQLLWSTIPIKYHTGVTWFLRRFFRLFFLKFLQREGKKLYNLYFSIRMCGKVGVVGNSRRRKFKYFFGLKKLANKSNYFTKTIFKKKFFLISTSTGVLGVWVKFYIS